MDAPLAEPRGAMLRLAGRLTSSDFLRDSAIVFASTMAMNVCGFLFHGVVSRSLGIENYGQLYALLAILPLVTVPSGIASTTIAKFAAEFHVLGDSAHLRALLTRVGISVAIAGTAVAVLVIMFRGPVAAFLHVPASALAATGLLLGVAITLAPMRGVLQGVQDFRNFAISTTLEGVSKTVFGVALVLVGLGVSGAILGYAIGAAISAICTWFVLERRYRVPRAKSLRINMTRLSQTLFGAFILVMTFSTLSYADALLVKHFMSPVESGLYAAASLGGKILLFAAGFVPMVLLPKAAAATFNERGPLRALAAAATMWAIVSITGLAVFYFAPGIVIELLVGPHFLGATHLLFLYAVAMALLGGMNIVGNYKLALHRFDFIPPFLLATVAEIGTIVIYHPTLETIIWTLIAGNALALLIGVRGITHWKGIEKGVPA